MGVRGLTTFINREKRFYETYHLHSTKLVIDGCGLEPAIYFDSDLNIEPCSHGGEHQMYYAQCVRFFQNMLSCGVECYVIFDGGYDRNALKFETQKRREQESIDSVREYNETGEGFQSMSVHASTVFVRVLDDLDIQYTSSELEADRDIAILANEFKCPVLGQDSDFFIMNVHEGYIPLDSLNWKNLCSSPSQDEVGSCKEEGTSCQPNKTYIQCNRFRLRTFTTYFLVSPSMMPLFATLSGNDYSQGFSLQEFYEGIKQRHQKPDGRPHPHRKGYWRFCKLLHHLTYFESIEECIEEVLKYVNIDERSKVKTSLQESCSMYDVSCSSDVVEYFRTCNSSDLQEPLADKQENCSTDSTEEEEVEMYMPAICDSILHQKTIFQTVQIEKISEPRASACCDHLLRILTGIMFVNEISEGDKNDGKKLTIDVFRREMYTYTCTKMEPKWNVHGFGKVPFYKDIPKMPVPSRRSFLLAALNVRNVNFGNIPESFHLILLASIYCYKNANPPVSKNIIHALALGWIQGVAWFQDNERKFQDEGRCQTESELDISWDGYEIQAVLQNYGPLTRKCLRQSPDFDASHAFMQWISCHRYTRDLNILLQYLFPMLDVRIWFNGILLHNLYYRLKEIIPSRHQNWVENGLMMDAPRAYDFYLNIMSFFSNNLNFETKSKREPGTRPLKGSGGQQHCGAQKETQGYQGKTARDTGEAGNSSGFSHGNSGKKKNRGSRKNRKKKGK